MTLDALQAEAARLEEVYARQELESHVRTLRALVGERTLAESGYGGDFARNDPSWGAGLHYISDPYDTRDGHFRPYFESQGDHDAIRAIARDLENRDELAIAVLRNLKSYIIGAGAKLEVAGDHAEVVAMVRDFLDEFDEVNSLTDEGESEALIRSVVDGDFLWALSPRGAAAPQLWYVAGEFVREPPQRRGLEDYLGDDWAGLNWSYGIASQPGQPDTTLGYFLDWQGDGTDWDVVPASRAVFRKRNVMRRVKRGLPDFFAPAERMRRGTKLFDFAVTGATIQASIAYIRKSANGHSATDLAAGLDRVLGGSGTARRTNGTTASISTEEQVGGKIITTSGFDYMYGPMGTPQGPALVDTVYQAVARRLGAVWAMPEYMVSGDASNANYASTMVAESPFVRNVQREQAALSRRRVELAWKAIGCAAAHGRFRGWSVADLRKLVTVTVDYQSPETRDPLQVESQLDRQQAAGVLSRKTRAAKSGLDYEVEIANGATVAAPAMPSAAAVPVPEQRIQSLRFSLLEGR